MSCPWLDNHEVKEMEKTQKYGPLIWELRERERNPGYQVKQYNIIIDVLGGFSADVSQTVKELVGEKSATILQRLQRSVISSTLNFARSFKILLRQRGLLRKCYFFRKKYYCILKIL